MKVSHHDILHVTIRRCAQELQGLSHGLRDVSYFLPLPLLLARSCSTQCQIQFAPSFECTTASP